ncbi:hypothetical protein QCA50_004469 [Cerrena zonata]|uniref:Uncharacterized protein n=1 Tax=Cerrena zonata TaxID=2478898 RepID=A0AAW0GLY5_9APHY
MDMESYLNTGSNTDERKQSAPLRSNGPIKRARTWPTLSSYPRDQTVGSILEVTSNLKPRVNKITNSNTNTSTSYKREIVRPELPKSIHGLPFKYRRKYYKFCEGLPLKYRRICDSLMQDSMRVRDHENYSLSNGSQQSNDKRKGKAHDDPRSIVQQPSYTLDHSSRQSKKEDSNDCDTSANTVTIIRSTAELMRMENRGLLGSRPEEASETSCCIPAHPRSQADHSFSTYSSDHKGMGSHVASQDSEHSIDPNPSKRKLRDEEPEMVQPARKRRKQEPISPQQPLRRSTRNRKPKIQGH